MRHVYVKASDIRRKFSTICRKVFSWCTCKRVASLIVHFAGAKCTGQMRQMRVRIRPSIPSLYYQTMQLPIGSAGSEFSRRASLRAYSSVAVSVFSKRRSGLTPFERMTERNSFREYDKRWMAVFFFFFFLIVTTAGWVTYYRLLPIFYTWGLILI